ncbi:hypothetical protein [Sphaerotilus microaerophilus]|uniref:Uncharacterized protein n=1 Tax=Sphaerotilus microaerophilus TaxID=2914710 RepID=A0ABM7YNL0_9BURK|nr:hypothetical protein [Sphaerotilus sp. FB-5]BDI06068.1 hypothetical protein CATMQ487_30380 [Sphaerotilus sp. FB-5]
MSIALLARPLRPAPPLPALATPPSAAGRTVALSGAFATPPDPQGIRPTPATTALVRTQVRSLLEATPSYHQLADEERCALEDKLARVAAYAAECLRDIYWQSEQIGQTPVLKETRVSRAVAPEEQAAPAQSPRRAQLAKAQANDFAPRAASQIGNVTQQTLRAIAFPTFVADLIRGTFDAIFQTTVKQMEAFSQLLSNVSKTVDQFMDDNVTDEQAHGWLAQTYPRHLTMRGGKAVPRDGADQLQPPNFETELHTSAGLDESSIEQTLLPAARRRLAETRLQMLSTMVLMGINRIVVTAGKIRATMAFHIDTSDSAFERNAEDVDARVAMRGHYNALVWGVEASASLAYVSSRRAGSDAEINTSTDLTGEVELHFKSDYFPVERFANAGALRTISGNTAVPEANPPPTFAPPRVGAPPPVEGAAAPRARRVREAPPTMTPVGAPLPEARLPTETPIQRGALDPGANNPVPAPTSGNAAGNTVGNAETNTAGTEPDAEPDAEPAAEGQSLGAARSIEKGLPWTVR